MQTPFHLNIATEYLHWRERKLTHAIVNTNELIVEVKNMHALSETEHATLLTAAAAAIW